MNYVVNYNAVYYHSCKWQGTRYGLPTQNNDSTLAHPDSYHNILVTTSNQQMPVSEIKLANPSLMYR